MASAINSILDVRTQRIDNSGEELFRLGQLAGLLPNGVNQLGYHPDRRQLPAAKATQFRDCHLQR